MTSQNFLEGVIGLDNLAAAGGVHTTERVWSLLLTALAVTDREVHHGVPREEWLNMCAHVYDQIRGALAAGDLS